MKEKVNCKKCKLKIDADDRYCPYCGYDQTIEEKETIDPEIVDNNRQEIKNIESLKFHRKEGAFSLSYIRHIALLLMMFFGLNLIALVVQLIIQASGISQTQGPASAQALLTLIAYPLLLVGLCLCLWKDFIPVVKTFKYWKNFLFGILYGVGIIVFSLLYNLFLSAVSNATANDNQVAVENSIFLYPVGSFFVLSIIGPLCEELGYRLGLYGLIRKKNMWVAVVVTSLIFGLIHFNFSFNGVDGLINELLNLPSYIICGAILCFAYETGGLASSMTAHVMNNMVATIMILVG